MNYEEAKNMAAGPLGDQMSKFPLRFCCALYFGRPPAHDRPEQISNGTATLLRDRGVPYALTCFHVLEGYRARKANYPDTFFSIGNVHLDPEKQLAGLDPAKDYVLIELSEAQAKDITSRDIPIGIDFIDVGYIAQSVKIDQYVAFGGFPGDLREYLDFNEISFGTYGSGACRVTDTHTDYLTCQFEKNFWVVNFKERFPENLRGMSGGPVCLIRHSEVGIISYDFLGFIYNMHEQSDSLYARLASALPIGWNK